MVGMAVGKGEISSLVVIGGREVLPGLLLDLNGEITVINAERMLIHKDQCQGRRRPVDSSKFPVNRIGRAIDIGVAVHLAVNGVTADMRESVRIRTLERLG